MRSSDDDDDHDNGDSDDEDNNNNNNAPVTEEDAQKSSLKERVAQWKKSRVVPGNHHQEHIDDDPLDSFMDGLEVPKDVQPLHRTQISTMTMDDLTNEIEDSNANNDNQEEDAFFQALLNQDKKQQSTQETPAATASENNKIADEQELLDDDEIITDAPVTQLTALEMLKEKAKKKEIKRVDHSKLTYPPFRKDFYIMSPEIAKLTEDQVEQLYEELEVKVRGKHPPRPIERWDQCGLTTKLLEVIEEQGWEKPFPIQRMTIPAIMSGRDVMGIAQTGSGKTLAYLIPMLRHIKDQPPIQIGDGPIALIIAPARELATQIHKEVKRFLKSLQIESVCMYGGSNIGEQIAAVRRGAHVVVGTPGRLIDVLASKGGRHLPLTRVTFVVLDEADRLFDMGFEPQVERILANVRPDRQTVLFSATFPLHVEKLARTTLQKDPLHIIVGGGNGGARVSKNIDQIVELRPNSEKFARLLQILGERYNKGNILVFCDTQMGCDALYFELEKAGYPCLSLHGGKDQLDRDYTIKDFKSNAKTLMVATGVAGRGLDVPDLNLVVNFDCPNHLEEYVHRVGRTGRAGHRGTAITFISEPEDAKYAGDMVVALKRSGQEVPEFLKKIANEFAAKVSQGIEHKHMSGYKTKGFSFEGEESGGYAAAVKKLRTDYTKQLRGVDDSQQDLQQWFDEDGEIPTEIVLVPATSSLTGITVASDNYNAMIAKSGVMNIDTEVRIQLTDSERRLLESQRQANQNEMKQRAASNGTTSTTDIDPSATTTLRATSGGLIPTTPIYLAPGGHSIQEVEINDLPQAIRQRITQKKIVNIIESEFRVSLTVKGSYFPPGKPVGYGEKKLHFVFEAQNAQVVTEAVNEMTRIIEDEASKLNNDDSLVEGSGRFAGGRYKI